MSDEQVEPGERVITSGGDRIYPKGYSVGTVIAASPDKDNDPFQVIKIKPAADIGRLEEVLVITKMADDSQTAASGPTPMRAADILSQRLPSVPKVDPNAPKTPGSTKDWCSSAKSFSYACQSNKPLSAGTEQKSATVLARRSRTATGTPTTPRRRTRLAQKRKSRRAGTAYRNAPAPMAQQRPLRQSRSQRQLRRKLQLLRAAPDSTTQQPSAAPTATPRATSTPAANQSQNQEKPPR